MVYSLLISTIYLKYQWTKVWICFDFAFSRFSFHWIEETNFCNRRTCFKHRAQSPRGCGANLRAFLFAVTTIAFEISVEYKCFLQWFLQILFVASMLKMLQVSRSINHTLELLLYIKIKQYIYCFAFSNSLW